MKEERFYQIIARMLKSNILLLFTQFKAISSENTKI